MQWLRNQCWMRRTSISLLLMMVMMVGLLPSNTATYAAVPTRALSFFGADMRNDVDNAAAEANITWARVIIDWVSWTRGYNVYDGTPNYQAEKTNYIINLLDNGFTPVVVVQNVPPEYRTVPSVPCSRPQPAYYGTLSTFMVNLVTTFKSTSSIDPATGQPRGVRYWQLFNEPDVSIPALYPGYPNNANQSPGPPSDPNWTYKTTGFGCWGNTQDAYWGGGEFANMLASVVPNMRAAAQGTPINILVGGLALNDGPSATSSKFFEGILRHNGLNDGANYFDIVDVHAYADGTNVNGPALDWDAQGLWGTYGGTTGGSRGKVQFVRNQLAAYGVTNKRIIVGEAGLTCYSDYTSCISNSGYPSFTMYQAGYAVRLYTRMLNMNNTANTNKVIGIEWYAMRKSGFHWSELMYGDAPYPLVGDCPYGTGPKCRPVYTIYSLMARLFQTATTATPISIPNAEAYSVSPPGAYRYDVYWTAANVNVYVPIPATCDQQYYTSAYIGVAKPTTGTIVAYYAPTIVRCLK